MYGQSMYKNAYFSTTLMEFVRSQLSALLRLSFDKLIKVKEFIEHCGCS